MKCPLIVEQITGGMSAGWANAKDCLKEECALWLEDIQMCAIRDLALETRYAQLRLADLSNVIAKKLREE